MHVVPDKNPRFLQLVVGFDRHAYFDSPCLKIKENKYQYNLVPKEIKNVWKEVQSNFAISSSVISISHYLVLKPQPLCFVFFINFELS